MSKHGPAVGGTYTRYAVGQLHLCVKIVCGEKNIVKARGPYEKRGPGQLAPFALSILLYSVIFCCILLYSVLFCFILFSSIMFYCVILLYYVILRYITLYYVILCFIMLHYVVLCSILMIDQNRQYVRYNFIFV